LLNDIKSVKYKLYILQQDNPILDYIINLKLDEKLYIFQRITNMIKLEILSIIRNSYKSLHSKKPLKFENPVFDDKNQLLTYFIENNMKKCMKCNVVKFLFYFDVNKFKKDGYQSNCKECLLSNK